MSTLKSDVVIGHADEGRVTYYLTPSGDAKIVSVTGNETLIRYSIDTSNVVAAIRQVALRLRIDGYEFDCDDDGDDRKS